MPKEKEPEGAPAYMGLYTTLMIVMLAFFIVLNTLTTSQDAGFESGVGHVKNAFGMKGGRGMFKYQMVSVGKNGIPVPGNESDEGEIGFDRNRVEGKGGSGTTDEDPEYTQDGYYLRIKIPFDFPIDSSTFSPGLSEYLRIIGMGFAFFDTKVTVRSYSNESQDPAMNRLIATKRSIAIMRYLHDMRQVDYEKLAAVGYDSLYYFKDKQGNMPEGKQATYFYIYQKKGSKTFLDRLKKELDSQ